MAKVKVLTVIGARPQFVKAAMVSKALARHPGVDEIIVHTGQHFDRNMSQLFFDELDIPRPNWNLGVGGGSHAQNTGRAMEGIERLILSERPDWVMVYGDTDSTLAGALAAAKLCVPIAHVEAGLRSFNRSMPEEINRLLTDHVSEALFAPSQSAVANLGHEGVDPHKVHHVGDVMYDAVLHFTALAERRSDTLSLLGIGEKGYVLATVHRKENVDDPERLRHILEGLGRARLPVVLPVHPRTRKRITEQGLTPPSNLRLIEPVGYLDMMLLQKHAAFVATDSGGLQKEAFFHGVPCAVLRDETEWTELLATGLTTLVGADPDRIGEALDGAPATASPAAIYGAGDAAERIAEVVGG